MRRVAILALALTALGAPRVAFAQEMTLAVSRISTTQTCTWFENTSGRSAAVATPWLAASASSWRSWWVKDCVTNFATMRSTLAAALASSGVTRVGTRGAHYSVSLNITGIAGGDARPTPDAQPTGDYSIAQNFMTVSMDVTVRDGAGRVVFGSPLTKKLEVGSDIKVGNFETRSNDSGEAAYGRMQNELALAAARLIAFHFVPLQVTSAQGSEAQLNYGTPLLQLGSLVLISSPDHRATLRYRVTLPSSGFATATLDGSGDVSAIVPGSTGSFVEPEDPLQNGRRMNRVDLP